MRVALGVEEQYGQEQLSRFYTALGTRFHPGGEPRSFETVQQALVDVGLPPELVALADTDEHDAALRASHEEGIGLVGMDVGTPVIKIGGTGIFGPVITPAPKGEDAGRVFDGVAALAGFEGFYELKRSRTQRPIFD